MSALTRKRLARVGSVRAIGDAATLAQTFHATDYVPAAIQDDYTTAVNYYNQFQNATQGLSVVNGTVQVSDKAAGMVDTGLTAALQVVPVLGQAYAIFRAVAPQAGAGPGTCAQGPPAGYTPSEIRAWPHYTSWAKFFEDYPAPAPGSFEALANSALQYNWELSANCFPEHYVSPPILLAAILASWNATHAGPTRTVTRRGLNPSTQWGLPPGFDPIAQALEIVGTGSDFTSSFEVNAGPMLSPPIKVIHLKLVPRPVVAPVSAKAPVPTTSGSSAALVATLALAGAAGFWVWTRKKQRLPIVPRKLARTLHLGR